MGDSFISRTSKSINTVQTTGSSMTDVMSQNACTNSFALTNHTHSASNITSGVLPVANGGTGSSNISLARSNLAVMTQTTLYSNASGTNSTITLSQSINNYDKIGVYYFNLSTTRFSGYQEFLPSVVSGTIADISYPHDGQGGFNISSAYLVFSGNTVTFARNCSICIKPSTVYMEELIIKIYRIVGYGY